MNNAELTEIRESLGLTKAALAELIGASAMLVGRMEKGSCSISEKVEEAVKALVVNNAASEEEKPKRKGGRKKKAEAVVVEEAPAVKEEPAVAEPVAEEPAPAEESAPAVEETPKKRARKKTAPSVTIQSAMGGSISIEEIMQRIPEGAEEVYIKVEENKAFWVKGEDRGFVLLWD